MIEVLPPPNSKGIAETVSKFKKGVAMEPHQLFQLNSAQLISQRWEILKVLKEVPLDEWLSAEEIGEKLIKQGSAESIPEQIRILQAANHPGEMLQQRLRAGSLTPEYNFIALGFVA